MLGEPQRANGQPGMRHRPNNHRRKDFKAVVLTMLKNLVEADPDNLALEGRDGGDTYHLVHRRQHTLRFRLHWSPNANVFRAYFRDVNDNESQAIVSMYTPYDAALFCTAAESLFSIRVDGGTPRNKLLKKIVSTLLATSLIPLILGATPAKRSMIGVVTNWSEGNVIGMFDLEVGSGDMMHFQIELQQTLVDGTPAARWAGDAPFRSGHTKIRNGNALE